MNTLISHSEDLTRLWREGYAIQTIGAYLLVHDVPYLSPDKKIERGTLVSVLNLSGDITTTPETHVCYFIGNQPSKVGGSLITVVVDSTPQDFGNNIKINFTLSASAPYKDYYEKITRYISILMNPALELDENLTAKTFEVFESADENSVFQYMDTNSAKAKINVISEKLKAHLIAILGVGGTGSYILDFIAKTPVGAIHLFDGDYFKQHNAFRSPGAAIKDRFYEHLKKTVYLKDIYSNMHRNIISHPYHMDKERMEELDNMDFVFICMDSGETKVELINYLELKGISFIDTGLGIQEIDGSLKGQVKITTSTPEKRDHFRSRVSFATTEDNLYDQNIQIAELNALNAIMAIIKWKKLLGFYHDLEKEFFSSFVTYTNETINDDFPT